jgi:hypothetical protein
MRAVDVRMEEENGQIDRHKAVCVKLMHFAPKFCNILTQ